MTFFHEDMLSGICDEDFTYGCACNLSPVFPPVASKYCLTKVFNCYSSDRPY
jgi:hypothetical protein